MLLRETFPAGAFECNCTILACGDTKDAVVIDPGGEVERIAEIVAQYDLSVRAIVHTHAHLDHIYCTRDVKDAHGGAICLHKGDAFLYDGFAMQAAMFGWKVRETLPVERWIEHGDVIEMGKRSLAVIHTPGHTPGSVCFELRDAASKERLLFAGDTLFRGSVGRTDLPGGDSRTLARSIKERLYSLDLDTMVIPGHGPTTKLGDEARSNPFVRLKLVSWSNDRGGFCESNGRSVVSCPATPRSRCLQAWPHRCTCHVEQGENHVHLQLRHVVVLVALASCDDTVTGQKPVGGSVDTEAEIQRYLRRVYLDLSGKAPSDADLAASTTRLQEGNNTPSARLVLVDELMAKPEFATTYIEELENSIFGGNTLETQYQFVCGIIRGTDPACNSCTSQDSCACQCSVLPAYLAERENLATAATDFGSGLSSGSIERRYALAAGYFVLAGSPEGRVRTLFDDFLGRTAEADEVENGRSMIFGAIIPGSPAGLMFHRHGATYDDLVDIVFSSEIYREAIVRRVFDRYLARGPSPEELGQFVTTIDATDPDARDLVRAVAASREYFEQ